MESSEPAPTRPEPHFSSVPLTPQPASTPFVFHGSAREYFRIWIVNVLLSFLTLGFFSAWATVRQRRYLRGNTEILGHRFNYTGDPRRILAGHVLVASLFVAYALFGAVYPTVRVVAFCIAVALLPWIILRSLAFNAHHTAWRGLRFRFHPGLSAAMTVYIFQALLVPLTLGFYFPAWARQRTKFRVDGHRLGTAEFHFEAKNGPFYRVYLAAGAMFLTVAVAVGFALEFIRERNDGQPLKTAQLLPGLLIYAAVLFVLKHYLFAKLFNPTWNGTRLAEHRFRATLSARRWIPLQIGNLLAVVGSCGLLQPWATIRSTRYVLSCLELQPAGSIDWIARSGDDKARTTEKNSARSAGMDFGL